MKARVEQIKLLSKHDFIEKGGGTIREGGYILIERILLTCTTTKALYSP